MAATSVSVSLVVNPHDITLVYVVLEFVGITVSTCAAIVSVGVAVNLHVDLMLIFTISVF